MRYFVYKDSQILGPFAREELGQAGGLHPETLLCPEGTSGRNELDWKSAEDLPEMSGLYSPLTATAVALAPVPESSGGIDAGFLERLELDALGVPDAESRSEDWLSQLFDDSEFRSRWGGLFAEEKGDPKDLAAAKDKVRELNAQVAALQSRLSELERGGLRASLTAAALPLPAPPEAVSLPPAHAAVATPLPEPEAPRAEPVAEALPALPAAAAAPPAVPGLPPAAEATSAPPEESGRHGVRFVPRKAAGPAAGSGAAPKKAVHFSAVKTFRVVRRTPAPEEPAAAMPEAKSLPPLSAPVETPVPAQQAPPSVAPALEPPATLTLGAPAPTLITPPPAILASPPAAAPPLAAPVPTPTLSVPPLQTPPAEPPRFEAPPTPAPVSGLAAPPMTLAFSGPAGGLPPPPAAMTPSRANAEPAASPGPDTQEVIARLAKPAPAPTAEPQSKKRSSTPTFLVVGGIFLVLLIVSAFLFLRNSRDLKTMVSMGSDQKPLGTEVPEDAGRANPFTPKPAPAPGPAPAPVLTGAAAAPSPAPAPAPSAPAPARSDSIPDAGAAAIGLVKNYPLDGDRGTVGQWLQYSFAANPGDGNKEEWTAGAVDASTYLVQYRVMPGDKSALKEPITYLFEADTGRGTVKGSNPAARELMGGISTAKPRKAARRPPRRAPHRAPAKPKQVPLLPLPSDADLLPPAEGDAAFRSDTVQ